jgi:hypothetical protein
VKAITACHCEVFSHPRIITNPPARTFVDYRVGDYTTFRQALLRARLQEKALADWQPSRQDDLAVQMLEWWAYLADVLTFYNEQAIQEVLLRTAVVPQDVRRIIRLLGYRPRPGIGATGVVAAVTDSAQPFVLPRGFAIEGLSAPGQSAQVFELDDDVEIGMLGRPLPPSARIPLPSIASSAPRVGRKIPAPMDPITRRFLNFIPARTPAEPDPPAVRGGAITMTLDRVVMTVQPGDTILFLKRNWRGHLDDPTGFAMATVSDVEPLWDATGHAITRMTSLLAHSLSAPHKDYRVLRASQHTHLWLYHKRYPGSSNLSLSNISGVLQVVQTIFDPLHLVTSGPPSQPPEDPRVLAGLSVPVPPFPERRPQGAAHLEAITRGINSGDPVLFEKRDGGAPGGPFRAQLVKVTGYSEEIWYANPPEIDRIGQGPPIGPPGSGGALAGLVGGGAAAPIPIPHSKITFDVNPFLDGMSMDGADIDKIVVHYGWEEVGEQVDASPAERAKTVAVPPLPGVPIDVPLPVLLKDATGKGKIVLTGQPDTGDGEELVPPLEALLHLLPISRGRTVEREVLGSGDSILIRQEFVLKRSPLTYLANTGPGSVDAYRSTLRIRVDGIEWHEVPSLHGVAATARVFVTREDDEQKTHVRFGDGETGARLPTGTDNIVAQYRYGSGAAVPPVGTLTSILKPQRGLQRIENPVPPGGGADPESREQVRRYAPRSVLTFGRAVSGDDYETVAAQTPGVQRARVYWSWDGASQRTLVKVFVGDDAGAVAAATAALRAFADPNRPVLVTLAAPMYADVSFTLEIGPAYEPESVRTAVSAALLDPRNKIFGIEVAQIGRTVYDSQIHEACLRIDGVRAVRALRFGIWTQEPRLSNPDLDPGPPPAETVDVAARSIALETLHFLDPGEVALPRDWQPNDRVDPPRGPRFTLEDVVRLESGVRHSPGEGSFYLLRGDRLHIAAEVVRHAE